MKKKIIYNINGEKSEREYNYIPVRYILAILITVAEVCAIIGILCVLCYYVPYFYLACLSTQIACVIKIISSDDNPEYKVPWLLFVLILPIIGFMLYFLFYSRSFDKKFIKKIKTLHHETYYYRDEENFNALAETDHAAFRQAKLLCSLSDSRLFSGAKQEYFPTGEAMWESMLEDLKNAKRFIYMEYFIIENGIFWDSILEILKEKAQSGLDVRVLFDDIGCMFTLPGNYAKMLKGYGIKALPFSRLKGQADSEFNNRSHRKITVIDGTIGYTGGVNIADEYINKVVKHGYWKDVGIRIEGSAVYEMTKLFLFDFGVNSKKIPQNLPGEVLYPNCDCNEKGFVVPFGDGPTPLYKRRVAESLILDMLANAQSYVYITTPYLIIDNDLCVAIENAVIKGVDVRIIVPHIPDKKIIFEMTKSFYERLMKVGVKIYEYTPGFIHAKCYLSDDKLAMVGTINMDYRSLVHHFENGVWLYDTDCIADIKNDIEKTIENSEYIEPSSVKPNLIKRFVRAIVRIFAPLL